MKKGRNGSKKGTSLFSFVTVQKRPYESLIPDMPEGVVTEGGNGSQSEVEAFLVLKESG